LLGLVGLVGVGANLEAAARRIGPLHELGELLIDLGLLGLEGLADDDLHDFARLGRHLALHHFAGEAVHGDVIVFLERDIADGDGAFLVIDVQRIATHDAHLAHLPADEGGMRRCAAERGEDAVGRLHAAQVFGRRFAPHQDHALAVLVHVGLGIVGEELDLARGGPGAGVDPLGDHLRLPLRRGIENRLEKLVQIIRRNPARAERLFLGDQAFLDHVHREADAGEAGALAVAGLQHPQFALLNRELDVLHVAVMFFEGAANLVELLVNRRHVFLQLGDLFGRPDAGDDVFALSIDEVFAVEDLLAGGGVAGEGDAGAGVIAHVAEDHGADVRRGAPVMRVAVLPAIDDGPVIVPGAEHGGDGAPHLFQRIVGEFLALLRLDGGLETLHELLQILHGQLGVELHLPFVLQLFHDVLKRIDLGLRSRLQVEHHVAVHLHEPAIRIPGEAFVAGRVDEALERGFVEADVEHRVHHAGHGDAGAGAAGYEQRLLRIAELRAHDLLGLAQRGFGFGFEFLGIRLVVGVVEIANFGGDGEPGRHRQTDQAHFGEIGPLAAEQLFHLAAAVRRFAAEEVDVFGHGDSLSVVSGE
jgi:hypothetical protein